MGHSWILYVVYALSTFRFTRLVVEDKITQFVRDWLREHGFVVEHKYDFTGAITETRLQTKPGLGLVYAWVFDLSSCHWCTSVWVGSLVVALAHYQGSWFQFVGYAASYSSIAGLLAKIEARL